MNDQNFQKSKIGSTQILTSARGQALSQVTVSVFGHLIGGAIQFPALVQKTTNILNLLDDIMVSFVHEALNSAARWTFVSLKNLNLLSLANWLVTFILVTFSVLNENLDSVFMT